ncbi:MAG: ORF6N domain-containing protein [Minisyncoccia bacterium]
MAKEKKQSEGIVPIEVIEHSIYLIRGQKVMLDNDLADLYGVATFNLNKAVKRNRSRFPEDFMFQLTKEEADSLRSQSTTSNLRFQFGISSLNYGGRRYLPYAFTEHGVAMLASVLKSERAIAMNILIIRVFIKLRELLATHKDLARKMEEIEHRQDEQAIKIDAIIKLLMEPPEEPRRPMGF